MQTIALTSGVFAVLSLGLSDTHIDKNLFRVGKIALSISALVFVISEAMIYFG